MAGVSARNYADIGSNNFYIRTRFDLRSTPLRIQIYLLQYKDRFVKKKDTFPLAKRIIHRWKM